MAVRLYDVTSKMLNEICDNFADKAVRIAGTNAPVDSGNLAGSIHWIKTGIGRYTVTTAAVGPNGFPYPARIEAGQWVVPNARNKYGAIWFKGKWHLAAAPSAKSKFMQKTVESLHI